MVAYIHSNEERFLHASTLGIIQTRWGKSTPLELPSGFVEGRKVRESAAKGPEDGSAGRGVDARRDVKVDRPWPGWAIGSCHAVGPDRLGYSMVGGQDGTGKLDGEERWQKCSCLLYRGDERFEQTMGGDMGTFLFNGPVSAPARRLRPLMQA